MQFRDPVTDEPLLSHSEEAAARREEEARVAELEALVARKR